MPINCRNDKQTRLKRGPAATALAAGLLLSLAVPATERLKHPGADEFAVRVAEEYGLELAYVRAVLGQAQYRQAIIDAINRPAEAKPWYEYRQIFLTPSRISEGVEFWRANAELIDRVAARYGIPPEVILAIVGVETSYGRITGGYRVVDALVTLGFYYQRRGEFFVSELAEFLRLGNDEGLDILELNGSYAGAMGLGQFMPSSYRNYAVDFDGDGRRDLWTSLPDAIASVANYLAEHGWRPGSGICIPVRVTDPERLPPVEDYRPRLTVADWRQLGVQVGDGVAGDTPASLIRLQGETRAHYWLGLQNFYVLTHYNRSPLYAMAVTQLSHALRQAYAES